MKYDHEIIRDLMPLCIDGIASEKSQKAVEEHIAECPDCAKEWDQMQTNIEQTIQEPLPEPTAKYAETATRVRKKSRWLLLRSMMLMLAGIFLVMVLGNWYIGNRYSSRMQAKRFVRSNWRDDEWMREVYHLDEVCSFSKLDLHFIGEVTTPDHKNREVFVTADIPGSDQIGFWSSDMSRGNPMMLGMWTDGGGGSGGFSKDEKLIMTPGSLHYEYGEKCMDYWMFYALDPNISQIVVQAFGEKQIIIPDNGFGTVSRELTMHDKMLDKSNWDTITEGEALDANGKVLYRLVPLELNENGETFTTYEWEKAE